MVVDFKWTLHEEGLIADRPTAGTDCRLYYATDEDILYYDDGNSWTAFDWAAGHVLVSLLTGATYNDVQDFMNFFGNRTLLSGGAISDGGSGTANIAACAAWCKESDSDTAVGKFFNYAGKTAQALTNNSVNAIYLDYNEGAPQIVVAVDYATYGFQQDHILIGAVYRQDTTLHIFQADNLGIGGDNIGFMHAVEHSGAHRASGMITTDATGLAIAVSTGVLYAGHIRHTTTADGSPFSYWYTEDSGTTWEEDTGQTVLAQNYNNIAVGKVGLGTGKYGVHWVYMDIDGTHLHVVYGQGNYNVTQAEEALVPSVLPPIVVGYCVLIAKIISHQGTTDLIITYPWTTVFTSSLATDHNSLANLTVGDVHTQYIKHALATAANDFLVASGSGVYVKKTLAETGAILEADLDHGSIQGLGDDDHTQYPLKTLWDANSILKADVNNTPEVLAVAEQRLIGRITGGEITALTATQIRTLLNVEDGAAADLTGAEIVVLLEALAAAARLSHNDGLSDLTAGDPHTQYVLESLFDAYSMLYADTDNLPARLTIAASRLVGRKASGGIAALTIAEALALLLTTKGDLMGFSTVPLRIPVGTDTHVLTADSAQAAGVKWAAAAAAGATSAEALCYALSN